MNDVKVTYGAKAMRDPEYAIGQYSKSWQAARKAGQVALVSVLANLYQSNDRATAVERINRVVAIANEKAMVEWGVRMGFTVGEVELENGKTKTQFVSAPTREAIAEVAGSGFVNAKELLWWSLKSEKPFDGYDLKKALGSLIGQAAKMQKRAESKPEDAEKINIDAELLAEIKRLAA